MAQKTSASTNNMQRVSLRGHLTEDVQLRTTTSGKSFATGTVAVNRRWKNSDGTTGAGTEYIGFTLNGAAAESAAKYGSKGRLVAIDDAELRSRTYESKRHIDAGSTTEKGTLRHFGKTAFAELRTALAGLKPGEKAAGLIENAVSSMETAFAAALTPSEIRDTNISATMLTFLDRPVRAAQESQEEDPEEQIEVPF